jgi:sulfur-carrier protein
MPMVTVRYWAAAKHAAGVAEETISGGTLSEVLATVAARPRETGPAAGTPGQGAAALAAVLERSSFLVNGEPVGGRAPDAVLLADAAVIEVLPPFAGG